MAQTRRRRGHAARRASGAGSCAGSGDCPAGGTPGGDRRRGRGARRRNVGRRRELPPRGRCAGCRRGAAAAIRRCLAPRRQCPFRDARKAGSAGGAARQRGGSSSQPAGGEFPSRYNREWVGTPQPIDVVEAPDIATGNAVALGQFPQRSGASGGKLLEPVPTQIRHPYLADCKVACARTSRRGRCGGRPRIPSPNPSPAPIFHSGVQRNGRTVKP